MYRPSRNLPPSSDITVQSAARKIHFKPNHSPTSSNTPEARVNTVLNQSLNRLACSHPITPTSLRGGGMPCGWLMGWVATALTSHEPDVPVVKIADQ